jgi:hypothetical protein
VRRPPRWLKGRPSIGSEVDPAVFGPGRWSFEMRELSDAETRVLHALFVVAQVPERTREIWADVPRATYKAVRKRAFASGWVTSRYVPDPRVLGIDAVTVRLDRPYADRRTEFLRGVMDDPAATNVWASPESVLSVLFERRGSPSSLPGVAQRLARDSFVVRSTDPGHRVTPYFDFEGAWSLWASERAPIAYPRGLYGSPGPLARQGRREREALRTLLEAAPEAPMYGDGPLRLSPTFLPRTARRLVDSGAVSRRTLPRLAALPPLNGGSVDQEVFVHGRLRRSGEADRLLPAVIHEGMVRPFLAAVDDEAAFLAMLAPAPLRLRVRRRPLLEILGAHLESIITVREPVAGLFPLLDHRYGQLIDERSSQA